MWKYIPSGKTIFSILVIIILITTNAPFVYAQWSSDPTVNNVICKAANGQESPHLTDDGSGGAFIAWADLRSGLNYDIYVQRITAGGQVQWAANGIAMRVDTIDQYLPQLVSDGSGGAIVVWENARRPGLQQNDIYAQRVSDTGDFLWTTGGVFVYSYPTSIGTIEYLNAVPDDSGGVIIVWDQNAGGVQRDIYAQRVNGSGVVQWGANGVEICVLTGSQFLSQIIPDGVGGAIITWNDDRSGNTDIYAQRINAPGSTQWQENGVAICSDPNNQGTPQIIGDGAGGAIITWDDFRNGVLNRDIYAQRIDSNGSALWQSNGVVVAAVLASHQYSPRITSDRNEGAIIAWLDFRNGGGEDIYAQRVNPNGVVQWMTNGVALSNRSGPEISLQIISDDAGGAIITWQHFFGGYDIYAQRINTNGVVQWANNGAAISTATSSQFNSQMIGDGFGSAIFVWEDGRNGNADIYAQRVNADGSLGGTTAVDDEVFAPDGFSLEQNYPNPFNPTTSIQYVVANRQFVSLKVYDVLGREVATLVNEEKPAGSYEVTFDASSLSSGVYFYKLQSGNFVETMKMILIK